MESELPGFDFLLHVQALKTLSVAALYLMEKLEE